MTWIVVLQMLVNLVLISGLVWVWNERNNQVSPAPDPELSSLKLALERRVIQAEEEIRKHGERAQEQIRHLSRIAEEASRLLKKAQTPAYNFAPSVEECELKAALTVDSGMEGLRHLNHEETVASPHEQSGKSIPTLAQLERTRQRLKSDISVDLRTLLKDQLA